MLDTKTQFVEEIDWGEMGDDRGSGLSVVVKDWEEGGRHVVEFRGCSFDLVQVRCFVKMVTGSNLKGRGLRAGVLPPDVQHEDGRDEEKTHHQHRNWTNFQSRRVLSVEAPHSPRPR